MPVVAFRFLKLDLKPELSDTVRPRGEGGAEGAVLCPSPPPLTLPPSHPTPSPHIQVRYTQLVRKKQKPQHRCARRGGCGGGSRRSGYAFSHQEGFGELIMSGKNMRLSSLALSGFTARPGAAWIETLRRKKGGESSPDTAAKG